MNRKEQLQNMLTPDNWEELEAYVQMAAYNEYGPDREITDQFYEDAINEIVLENMTAMGIMREDKQTIRQLELECAALRKALEFYAEPSNYEGKVDRQGFLDPEGWILEPSDIQTDEGKIARAALGEGNPHS